ATVEAARRTLTWIVIGSLLAMALNPLVVAVERRLHLRRALAVGTVLVGLVALVSAAVLLLGPPAIREAQNVTSDLPNVAKNLGDIPVIGGVLRDNDVPAKLEDFLRNLPQRLGQNDEPVVAAIEAVLGGALAEFLVYQQLENHVIQPTIVGEAVDLSPPVTMMAALVGASAAGVPGALIAVPLLGAAKAVAMEVRPPATGREPAPPKHRRNPF